MMNALIEDRHITFFFSLQFQHFERDKLGSVTFKSGFAVRGWKDFIDLNLGQ